MNPQSSKPPRRPAQNRLEVGTLAASYMDEFQPLLNSEFRTEGGHPANTGSNLPPECGTQELALVTTTCPVARSAPAC